MPGHFLLSFDTELAWGSFDRDGLRRFGKFYAQTRPCLRRMLMLLETYRIPATWAFVGHLLLDRCRRENGTTHPDVMRPRHSWYPHDWHALDPGTDVDRDPFWYGTDMLESIRSSSMQHEVGTHTFSHVVFDDPACGEAVARSQLIFISLTA